MNKKFSTLIASALLAGGLFSTANAVTVEEAAKTGKYYYMLRTAQYNQKAWSAIGATEVKAYLNLNAKGAWMSTAEPGTTAAALWKVTVNKDADGKVLGYTFTNRVNQALTYVSNGGNTKQTSFVVNQLTSTDVTGLTADAAQIYVDAAGATQIALTWPSGGWSANPAVSFVEYATMSNNQYVLAFDLAEVPGDAYTKENLDALNGTATNFNISVGYLKDNKANKWTAYSDLQGNVFTTTLKASNSGVTGSTLAKSGSYYLTNANGSQYLVLLNEKWSNFNTDHSGQGIKGHKFAWMKKADLETQLARDAQGGADAANPVILGYSFIISENINDNPYIEVMAYGKSGNEVGELYVADFNNVQYLTVAASLVENDAEYNNSTNKTYVKFGAGNAVDMTAFAQKGYYTIVRKSDGLALAPTCGKKPEFVSTSKVQLDMPEGMWALSKDDNGFTFVNRESQQEAEDYTINMSANVATNLYSLGGNLYELNGVQYYITPQALGTLAEGYADFGKTTQKSYNVGVYSPVWGGVAYMSENHSKSHQIGLDTDAANATAWRLIANDEASEINKVTDKRMETDSLYVIHQLPWYGTVNNVKGWYTVADTLKAVSYQLKNIANGEMLGYDDNNNLYACNQDAKNFVFKKVGEAYNMVEVTLPEEGKVNGNAEFASAKVYGGDSADKGILDFVYCIYDRTENDLFKVEEANAGIYRRLVNNLDTVSIYRNENASQLLYEEGGLLTKLNEEGKTEVLAGFLGLQNENQFEIAPAMLADAAYAPEDTDRPQYLLAVDATVVPAGKYCPEHGVDAGCKDEHLKEVAGWVEGRYLVNLKDSAIAFDNNKKDLHAVNPYTNTENLYRLGFVQATHRNDSLIIASTEDQIYVGDEDFNVAKFAFKYVDLTEGSFVIETACYETTGEDRGDLCDHTGYLKWMNGVVVVVENETNADIFNMNEEETRIPTANEAISAAAVTVVAGEGNVTIAGAAGKKVVIANILGQTIANTVLTSDNATIAAPAGVVVVAVEGEAAVKAIVK